MKKKVYREKYGIKNDGDNFGNAKIIKDKVEVVKIKSKKKEVK